MNRFLLIAFLLFIGAGCGEDDSSEITPTPKPETTIPAPKTTVLIKVNINPGANFSSADDWLIVNDSHGSLLAYHSFESGQSFEMTTTEPVTDKILLSRFRRFADDPSEQDIGIITWADVTPGQEFVVPAKITQGIQQTGTFTVKLDYETGTNIDFPDINAMVSCSEGFASGSGGIGGDLYILSNTHYEGITKYLLTASNLDQMGYKFLEGVHAGDVDEVKFSELTPFEHQIEFTFPETDHATLFTTQAEPGKNSSASGYQVMKRWPDDMRSSLKAGYISSLGAPLTYLELTYETGNRLIYTNNGEIPTGHVGWPAFSDYKVISEDINTYAYSAPERTKYGVGQWRFTEGNTLYGWTFYSSNHVHVIPNLPEELLTKYPGIIMDKFRYTGTHFVAEGLSYEAYIKGYFERDDLTATEVIDVILTKK